MPSRLILPEGKKFGSLIYVQDAARSKSGRRMIKCLCDCGTTVSVHLSHLTSGHTKSCGCLSSEVTITRNRTHGMAGSMPEYMIWKSMKSRCSNPLEKCYKNYGGRGIVVAPEWTSDFPRFLADVGRRPSPSHTLDRYPNNDGNYEPGNVRWATRTEQSHNKRNNSRVIINGVGRVLAEVCREIGFPCTVARYRQRAGWPDSAIFSPIKPSATAARP